MAGRYKSSKFNYRKKFVPAGFKDKSKSIEDAKKRQTLYSEDWDNIRKLVYQRDGNRCVMCGKRGKLHAHHIVPVKISKDNSLSNLVSVCNKCHRKLEEVGFAILERGGGRLDIKKAELSMIVEAKKKRAADYMKKIEEKKKNETGHTDPSINQDSKDAEGNDGNS